MGLMDQYREVIRIVDWERGVVPVSRKDRLAFLIKWSVVRVEHRKGYKRRRRSPKYSRNWRLAIVSPCWVCGTRSTARHHIIQVQHGGGNDCRNIVPICDGCHAEVHPWMDASTHPIVMEAQSMDKR